MIPSSNGLRDFILAPIPQIAVVAQTLDDAVTAHLEGDRTTASNLFKLADDPMVRNWLESIWGKGGKKYRNLPTKTQPSIPKDQRYQPEEVLDRVKFGVHERDGLYCRFCGIPVIRDVVRRAVVKEYPDVVPWGRRNVTQHAGFQCLWAQYDHFFPHHLGGTSELSNIILTCAACNYGKDRFTIEELSLRNPFDRPPVIGSWDGLERFSTKNSLK